MLKYADKWEFEEEIEAINIILTKTKIRLL